MSNVAGRRGVREHPVAAIAHEERDRLVHPLALGAVRVVDREHQLLPALVETRERLAAAEQLLSRRQREHRGDAARVIGRTADEREGQRRGQRRFEVRPDSGSASGACRRRREARSRHGFSEIVERTGRCSCSDGRPRPSRTATRCRPRGSPASISDGSAGRRLGAGLDPDAGRARGDELDRERPDRIGVVLLFREDDAFERPQHPFDVVEREPRDTGCCAPT